MCSFFRGILFLGFLVSVASGAAFASVQNRVKDGDAFVRRESLVVYFNSSNGWVYQGHCPPLPPSRERPGFEDCMVNFEVMRKESFEAGLGKPWLIADFNKLKNRINAFETELKADVSDPNLSPLQRDDIIRRKNVELTELKTALELKAEKWRALDKVMKLLSTPKIYSINAEMQSFREEYSYISRFDGVFKDNRHRVWTDPVTGKRIATLPGTYSYTQSMGACLANGFQVLNAGDVFYNSYRKTYRGEYNDVRKYDDLLRLFNDIGARGFRTAGPVWMFRGTKNSTRELTAFDFNAGQEVTVAVYGEYDTFRRESPAEQRQENAIGLQVICLKERHEERTPDASLVPASGDTAEVLQQPAQPAPGTGIEPPLPVDRD